MSTADTALGGNCRFYEAAFPELEECVMVNVKRIAEMGAYVQVSGRTTLPRVCSGSLGCALWRLRLQGSARVEGRKPASLAHTKPSTPLSCSSTTTSRA